MNESKKQIFYPQEIMTNFEHLCLIGDSPCLAVSEMSRTELMNEIEALGEGVQKRIDLFQVGTTTASPSTYLYMTSRETSRMHYLKMALPSSGQLMLEAKERISERIRNRKAKKHTAN